MIDRVVQAAREVGDVILPFFRKEGLAVTFKEDKSPLTVADTASHVYLVRALNEILPVPVLSEEGTFPYEERRSWERFWVIDPLDGTKEFIAGVAGFTINIALVEDCYPILGVVHLPAMGKTYWALKGGGSFRDGERIMNTRTGEDLIGAESVFHPSEETRAFFARHHIRTIVNAGAAGKFGLLAEGSVDIYPRLAGSHEWDTAAGQIIAEEAGCEVVEATTRVRMHYNKELTRNPFFIACRKGLLSALYPDRNTATR